MDFYAHQDRARAASRRLGVLFVLSLLAVVAAVNGAAILGWSLLGWWLPGMGTHWPRHFVLTNTMVTLLIVVGGAWVEMHRLSEGASVLARRLGARPLDDSDALHRRLRDVAEEVAIGAGVPVPALYVLEDPTINALAAGERPALAAVMVTRGALERLQRAELQAVVAHEVAHIVSGDTGLNMRLTGALYGLCSLRLAGFRIFDSAFARDGALHRFVLPRFVMFVAGSLLSAVGMLGVAAAQVLRAGISRQREFLADALAVQITRDRDGLGGALRRIAGEVGTESAARRRAPYPPYAALVSHFLLVRPSGTLEWLPSHPPLAERIRRLYGRWMPPIAAARDSKGTPHASADAYPHADAAAAGRAHGAGFAFASEPLAGDGDGMDTATAQTVDPLDVETIPFVRAVQPYDPGGFGVYGGAPASDVELLRPPPSSTAPATVLIARIRAASLGFDTAGRWLEALVGGAGVDEADGELRASLQWVLSPAGSMLRVPLLELLLARVRRWSSAHRRELLERCRHAIERDGRVESSEWVYYTLARHRLMPVAPGSTRPRRHAGSRAAQTRALAALFAMAAAIGEASARTTRDALADAAAILDVPPPAATPDEVGTTELAQALDTLVGLPPLGKPILLKVLRRLARTPGDPDYEAFLRAVAAAIDCPVPREPMPPPEARRAPELAL